MSAKQKVDLRASMRTLTEHAEENADSRFQRAAKVISHTPSGTAPSRPIFPTEHAPVPLNGGRPTDVIWAPISLVRDNPRNARKLYDQAVITERAASVAKDGQMTPAPACLDWENPGGYILIGGHYRKRALLHLGHTEIQLKLMPAKTYVDLYRLSYVENDERSSGTPLDNALAWKELLDSGDMPSHDAIADIVKLPRSTVTKTLGLLDLPTDVIEVLKSKAEKFTFTAGYQLTQLMNVVSEAELVAIARDVAAGNLSTRDLDRLREEKDRHRKERKTKEISRQHKIMSDGSQIGHIKEWDSGKVILEVMLSDHATRQKLVEELRQRFGLDPDAQQLVLK